jgi:Cu(I)/Ag(I) efflux system membrane fusion protein
MHPSVVSEKPGSCPICGMDLVKKSKSDNNTITLSAAQMKLANITTQKVGIESVGQTISVNARLTVNEERVDVISSRVGGRIDKLFIKETGRVVHQGEPLYELYSESLLTMQKEFLVAKEQYETLGKTEPRYESMVKAAEKKLLLYGLSKKQVEQLADSKSTNQHITFLAPASGIVKEINVTEGKYITEGTLLYRIEDVSQVWVEAELYPNELLLVKTGEKVNVIVSGFESNPIEATVTFINPEFKAGTQITLKRAALSNPGLKLKPGMQAQVLLPHSKRKNIAVPTDAVIRDSKGSHVYVNTENNSFQPRMVKTGAEDFEQVEITEGLEDGEQIAVSGAYLLYSELVLKKGGNPMVGHHHEK